MKFQVSDPSKTEALAFAYILSAYEGCGHTTGMGIYQARAVVGIADIPQLCNVRDNPRMGPSCKVIHADYVAGRMVKTHVEYDPSNGVVSVSDGDPTPDYHGWSNGVPSDPGVLMSFDPSAASQKFSSYEELLRHAAGRIGVVITHV
jgi:hypothetical protein